MEHVPAANFQGSKMLGAKDLMIINLMGKSLDEFDKVFYVKYGLGKTSFS